jgi:flagellar basal-body rod modification protein FlgD
VTSTDPVAAAAGAATPPKSAAAATLGALDGTAFLKLLVAQLKYQNPLSPTDPTAMLGQTAQLTAVEKLDGLSAALQSQLASQRTVLAASLVGKTITAGSTTGVVSSVSLTGDVPVLTVGTAEVRLPDVETVR